MYLLITFPMVAEESIELESLQLKMLKVKLNFRYGQCVLIGIPVEEVVLLLWLRPKEINVKQA